MIEALTPQLLVVGLLLATVLASLLTLLVAEGVLLAYRRRVLHEMDEPAAPADTAWPRTSALAVGATPVEAGAAIAATRRAAASMIMAGIAFAAVFAVAAVIAFPVLRSPARFALAMWACSWPIVPALLGTLPMRRRTRALLAAAPWLLWAGGSLLVGAVLHFAVRSGQGVHEYFYAITPLQALGGWLLANAPPTLMWWLFGNRRLRAIGPLVLGFAVAFAAGVLMLPMWLVYTSVGTRWLMRIADAGGLSPLGVVMLSLLPLLVASMAVGWACMAVARRAFLRKRANDQSLLIDALWLLFAVWYAMVLVLAGVPWLLTAVLGFIAYRLVLQAGQRAQRRPDVQAPSLVFLRVFSLGARSDRLFDRITRYWRHLGCIDLICGPDIAHGTVQPHQLMDFLAGRIATHFIAGPASLEQRLAERDRAPDRDGRFRVNSFYCHADTWRRVLQALVGSSAVVLMDLRSLSPRQRGCVEELHHLVGAVPLQRCVLVVDDSTDRAFLQDTLTDAWQAMPAGSPNRQALPGDVPILRFDGGEDAVRALLARLCAATVAASGLNR